MKFVYPLVADAGGSLDDFRVDDVVSPVEKFFCEHLEADWGINVIVTTSMPWMIIPEDGVGGRTYASDFVVLAVDRAKMTPDKCSEMLAHELAHAIRWGKNPERSRNLFCELVSEGLAVHIEAEFAKNRAEKTFFLETILGHSDEENRAMFEKLRPEFESMEYDYDGMFFGGRGWPRWAGYSVGYYIVKGYLRKSGKSIFDAVAEPYDLYL